MRIVRMSELKMTPWKNGGGVTREIAAFREGKALAWRLSMADVASDGPFSTFEGLTRILTVMEGNGIDLISAGGSQQALYGAPVCFDGELVMAAKLIDGPVRDLNLMFDKAYCSGSVTLVTGPSRQFLQGGPAQTVAVCGLRGQSQIDAATHLFAGDTMLLEEGAVHLALPEGAEALLIMLALRAQTDSSSLATVAR